jgi:hypothetical protein
MTNGFPTIHDIHRPFNRYLYVKRKKELGFAYSWREGRRRVLTVLSPPANGKSWFLEKLHDIFLEEGEQAFKVNFCEFLAPGLIGNREIDEHALQTWVESFVGQVYERCESLPNLNLAAQVPAILDKIAGYASEKCWPHNPIYLFVDGGDEPSSNTWRRIELEILEPIIRHGGWRLLIALRQEQRLYSYLLRQTERQLILSPLSEANNPDLHQGYDQLDRLIANEMRPVPTREQIISLLPGYSWIHPGINTFLFLEVCQNFADHGRIFLHSRLLARSIIALLGSKDDFEHARIEYLANRLRIISEAQAKDEWTIEELATILQLSRTEAWQTIKPLHDYQLIVHTENRYKIMDGLREFTLALVASTAFQKSLS